MDRSGVANPPYLAVPEVPELWACWFNIMDRKSCRPEQNTYESALRLKAEWSLTFERPWPNLSYGNRIARGVPMTFLPEGGNDIGKNRKAGESPARARHCDRGIIRHGLCQSLSRPVGAARRKPVTVLTRRDGKAPNGDDPRVRRPAALATPLRGSSGQTCMQKPPSSAEGRGLSNFASS